MTFAAAQSGEMRTFFEQMSDIVYVRNILTGEEKVTHAYRSQFVKGNKWVNVTFRVLHRHEDGTPALFVLAFNEMDTFGSEREELRHSLDSTMEKMQQQMALIGGLATEYTALYHINLDKGTYTNYSISDRISDTKANLKKFTQVNDLYSAFVESDAVYPEHKEQLRALRPTAEAIGELLAHRKNLSTFFRRKYGDEYLWTEMDYIKFEDINEEPHNIALGFIEKDKEIRARLERQQQEQKKNDDLISAFANEYEAVYLGSLKDGSYKVLVRKENILQRIKGTTSFGEAMKTFAEWAVHPKDRENFRRDLYSIEAVKAKLAIGESYYFEYRSNSAGDYAWHRAAVIRIDDDEILVGFRNCDDEVRVRLVNEKLMDAYDAIYTVDLKKDEINPARSSRVSRVGAIRAKAKYSEMVRNFANSVAAQYQQDWINFSDPAFLKKYMAEEDHREYVYELPEAQNKMRRFSIDVIERIDGEAVILLLSFMGIDDHRAKAIRLTMEMAEQKEQLQKNFDIIEILASEYTSVYYIDLATDGLTPYTMNESTESAFGQIFRSGITYSEAYCMYVEQQVLAEDKKMMLEAGSVRNIVKELQAKKTFLTTYRDAKGHYSEMKFVKVGAETGKPLAVALGFADKDEEIRGEMERQAIASRDAAVIAGLSDDFGCVVYVSYETSEEIHYRFDPLFERNIPGWSKINHFNERLRTLMNTIMHPDDRKGFWEATRPEVVKEAVEKDNAYFINFRTLIGDEITYYQLKFVRDENSDTHVIVGFHNVDAETKREMDALDRAESASRAKTDFLFNMSHDIRTPMNAITGFTTMAKKYLGDRERVTDYLNKIDSSGKQLLMLVNQVLEMARIESGKLELEENPVNVKERFDTMVAILEEQAEVNGLEFRSALKNITHYNVLADDARMSQITLNIVGNALKYTPEGGSIEFSLEEKTCDRNGFARYLLSVADTGIGMSKEFLKVLFEPFAREKSSTVSHIQGTGLGLPIVKNLVDLMQGTIDVQSEPGKGTRFGITLDFKINENAATEAMAKAEAGTEEEKHHLAGKRILLVEDNELNREIAKDLLEEMGLLVEEADDGDVAVKLVSEKGVVYYDAVLMDIQMPMMNGYEATREIRRLSGAEKLPIIALSANAFEEDRHKSLQAGMNDHVAKPIDVNMLVTTLAKFL